LTIFAGALNMDGARQRRDSRANDPLGGCG
jgi:hypothetical protein